MTLTTPVFTAYLISAFLPDVSLRVLSFIQTLGQMLAHVGSGSQRPAQLVGLISQGAAQDITGGPGLFLLCHTSPKQDDFLLSLVLRLAHQLLHLPLFFF